MSAKICKIHLRFDKGKKIRRSFKTVPTVISDMKKKPLGALFYLLSISYTTYFLLSEQSVEIGCFPPTIVHV